uniref:Protease-associated domain-containing protein 1 n=1 Tax=Aceria tosichella TaxID=561515 RepID=A0A6G1SK56_9ACAR
MPATTSSNWNSTTAKLVVCSTHNQALSLAISILVILYLIPPNTVFILCDSDNHHQTTTATRSTQPVGTNKPEHHQQQQQQLRRPGVNNDNSLQFISRGDVYFLISEPESLRYTFKARSSRIGVPFTNTLSNIALVLAEPRDACTSTINKLEIRGNVALVERGGCSFLEKCIEIERSGGIALIVYDYDKHNDENYIEMIDDNTSRNCSIPAVSLLGKDGYMIVHSLLALKLNRAVISIPINVAKGEVSNPPWLMW